MALLSIPIQTHFLYLDLRGIKRKRELDSGSPPPRSSSGSNSKDELLSSAISAAAAAAADENERLKKKKVRTTFTGRQIFELEKMFETKKYLSSSERTELAKMLNVTEQQVIRDFINKNLGKIDLSMLKINVSILRQFVGFIAFLVEPRLSLNGHS